MTVMAAQQEPSACERNYVGSEQIILGLLATSSGIGGEALKSIGLTHAQLRQEVEQTRMRIFC